MTQVVNIENKTNRMVIIEVDHPDAPRKKHIHYQRAREKNGAVGIKRQRLGVHDSIILLAGQKQYMLPRYVADVPDVKRLGDNIVVTILEESAARELMLAAKQNIENDRLASIRAAAIKAEKRKKISDSYIAKRSSKPAAAKLPLKKKKSNGNGNGSGKGITNG